MFKTIVMSACLAGLAAGVVLTLAQAPGVLPIIAEAERYETRDGGHTHGHDAADQAAHHHGHDGQAWAPADGFERTAWTLLSNVGAAIGFSMIVCAVLALLPPAQSPAGVRKRLTRGLLWGLAGYVVFFANPALGLRPEIPGAMSAALYDRQLWWIFTVVCSSVAIALIAWRPAAWVWPLAVALLVLPHLIGAPQPALHGGLAPQALADRFVWASAFANLVFWLSLGAFSALVFYRLDAPRAQPPASDVACTE